MRVAGSAPLPSNGMIVVGFAVEAIFGEFEADAGFSVLGFSMVSESAMLFQDYLWALELL